MDRRDSFWAGMMTYVAISSLHQDALGKEKWIEFIRAEWVSGWWTVPLALVFFLLGIASYAAAGKKDKADAIPKVQP